jgi:hypothetical protein
MAGAGTPGSLQAEVSSLDTLQKGVMDHPLFFFFF